VPNETQHLLEGRLPEHQYRALVDFAEREGLTFDEAVLRLATENLAMRQLGQRLGIKDFEVAPR
jgi:hypothetical protein